MGLAPNIQRQSRFSIKACNKCKQTFGPEGFAPTKSLFYPDGTIPICNDCVDKMIAEREGDWDFVDQLCQMANIPFIPKEWEKLAEMSGDEVFYRYATVFQGSEYEGIGWKDYYEAFRELKRQNELESELPRLADDKRRKLKEKWGANYDDDGLNYLEGLFNGLLTTQNVNGALQVDQALKICKMSYEIDSRIAAGDDFDKLLSSYDKMVKAAEFTPKNAKNINDFDTFGESTKWMEKHGWVNKFYDNVTRDIVDESMKNFETFNQRLYINESNIGDEISRRLEALKTSAEMEDYYETGKQHNLDAFEQEGYDNLFNDDEDEFVEDVNVSDEGEHYGRV